MRTLKIIAIPLFAALVGGQIVPGAPRVSRDWKKYPAVVQVDTTGDIYAFGDIHGDVERLRDVLAGAGVVHRATGSDHVSWAAGRAVLVFTGDLIDKGPDSLSVLAFLQTLRADAAHAGGQVVILMGNHEAEFLANPDSEKASGFAAELKAAHLNENEVAQCRQDPGAFLCSLPVAARVNGWFFSHAGNTAGRSIPQIESEVDRDVDAYGFAAQELIGDDSILEARLGAKGANGKSWFEAGMPRLSADGLLAKYAAAAGVAHIVQGHHRAAVKFPDGSERQAGEMFQWQGKLFLIDTGMSRQIGDSGGAVLHIQRTQAFAVCPDGHRTLLWDAAHSTKSGKAAPCPPRDTAATDAR